jgi:repressor LexA
MFICQLFFERLFDIFFIYGIINLNKRMRGKKMRAKSLEKQKKILDFVNRQVQEKGYPPSVREICKAVGFKSTSTVHAYLASLEAEGLISKEPAKTRALKVIDENSKNLEGRISDHEIENIPILGQVTAGQPILAVENIEDTFPVPVQYLDNSPSFILKIKGDSMLNAGILDGDFVVVKQQNTANNGDIVVALIGDEATVKTFYRQKDHIVLQPENDAYDPIIVKDDVSILGKVTALFRKF